MRRLLVVGCLALASICVARPAHAGKLNALGRYLGLGWSDGYHSHGPVRWDHWQPYRGTWHPSGRGGHPLPAPGAIPERPWLPPESLGDPRMWGGNHGESLPSPPRPGSRTPARGNR